MGHRGSLCPTAPIPGPHPTKKKTEQLWHRISHATHNASKQAAQRLLSSQFGTFHGEMDCE